MVSYHHAENCHTLDGPRVLFPIVKEIISPASILDVGCGLGTWLLAATTCGIPDYFGVDGVAIPAEELLIEPENFRVIDLTRPWSLGRKFDLALCLEVAEHLPEESAPGLIDALTNHADQVLFSAAIPNQPGENHINGQWPIFWQELFNAKGFRCDDSIRWRIWNIPGQEWWYRQNMFLAQRDPKGAGLESRLLPVVHPALYSYVLQPAVDQRPELMQLVENGHLDLFWYLKLPFIALKQKLARRLGR